MLGAQIHEAREPTHPRHGQIEQDKIDLVIIVQLLCETIEIGAFDNAATGDGAHDGLMQGAAHERMIVGYDNTGSRAHD